MSNTQCITGWHKSTYSAQEGACVEQGLHPAGLVALRDSKWDERAGDVIMISAPAWGAFTRSL